MFFNLTGLAQENLSPSCHQVLYLRKKAKRRPPMSNIIETRCTQGKLIVTDEFVRVQLGGPFSRQQTLYRSSLTGVDAHVGVPSVFGLGGGTNLVFHGQGAERLHANMVKKKVAQEIVGMLQHSQTQK
jgi:hypothetical protein